MEQMQNSLSFAVTCETLYMEQDTGIVFLWYFVH